MGLSVVLFSLGTMVESILTSLLYLVYVCGDETTISFVLPSRRTRRRRLVGNKELGARNVPSYFTAT